MAGQQPKLTHMSLAYRAKPQHDAISLHSNYCPAHFIMAPVSHTGSDVVLKTGSSY